MFYLFGGISVIITLVLAIQGVLRRVDDECDDHIFLKKTIGIIIVIASLYGQNQYLKQCEYDKAYEEGYSKGRASATEDNEDAYDRGYSEGYNDRDEYEEEYQESSEAEFREYVRDRYYDDWRDEVLEEYGIYE